MTAKHCKRIMKIGEIQLTDSMIQPQWLTAYWSERLSVNEDFFATKYWNILHEYGDFAFWSLTASVLLQPHYIKQSVQNILQQSCTVCNDMNMNNWLNFYFWVNYHFKVHDICCDKLCLTLFLSSAVEETGGDSWKYSLRVSDLSFSMKYSLIYNYYNVQSCFLHMEHFHLLIFW